MVCCSDAKSALVPCFGYVLGACKMSIKLNYQLKYRLVPDPAAAGIELEAICNFTGTLLGNKIYYFGGTNGKEALNQLIIFDIEKESWTYGIPPKHSQLPLPRCAHSAVALSPTELLVYGGINSTESLGDFWVLHASESDGDQRSELFTNNFEWKQQHPVNEVPSARYGHSANRIGSNVYIFGGNDGICEDNELYVLDSQTFKCTIAEVTGSSPLPRVFHSTNVYKESLFVYGGCEWPLNGAPMAGMHEFDTTTFMWSEVNCHFGIAPLLSFPISCVVGSHAYFIFGNADDAEDTVNVFDLMHSVWYKPITISDFTFKRNHSVIAGGNNRIYVFGGNDGKALYYKDLVSLELVDQDNAQQSTDDILTVTDSVDRVAEAVASLTV